MKYFKKLKSTSKYNIIFWYTSWTFYFAYQKYFKQKKKFEIVYSYTQDPY